MFAVLNDKNNVSGHIREQVTGNEPKIDDKTWAAIKSGKQAKWNPGSKAFEITDNPAFAAPTHVQLLGEYRQAASEALEGARDIFDRIAWALAMGKIQPTDPSVQAWDQWRTDTQAQTLAMAIGKLPEKPTTYPAGI